jgi:hypothetical protein
MICSYFKGPLKKYSYSYSFISTYINLSQPFLTSRRATLQYFKPAVIADGDPTVPSWPCPVPGWPPAVLHSRNGKSLPAGPQQGKFPTLAHYGSVKRFKLEA